VTVSIHRADLEHLELTTMRVPVFDAARALCTGAGFTSRGPFGAYHRDRHNVFLTVAL